MPDSPQSATPPTVFVSCPETDHWLRHYLAEERNKRDLIQAYALWLAPMIEVSVFDVLDQIDWLPDEILALLDTPFGWVVLGSHVAMNLDAMPVSTFPTVQ